MSSVEAARPFVDEPPPPAIIDEPEPESVGIIEQPTFDSVGIDAHTNVIRVRPSLNEMSPIEVIEVARPYVAILLATVGVCIIVSLAIMLYRRYRRENFAERTREALDRRSVRRRQQESSGTSSSSSTK